MQTDLILWVHPSFPNRICLGSGSEGAVECVVVCFSWRVHGLLALDSPGKTSTCFLLKARLWLCPEMLLRGGRYYSISVNKEEKRQISNEVSWILTAFLLCSSLRGLKRWYWDGLLNKSVQLLTFTAAEQFSSAVTISLICSEINKKCVQQVIKQGALFEGDKCTLWHSQMTLKHMIQDKRSCREAYS